MAKKKRLTALQEEYGRELRNLRRRWQAAIKAGYLNERIGRKIPSKITDEYIREHASRREINRIKSYTAKEIRTPQAQQLYQEVYQNQTTPQEPPTIGRRELINSYINALFDYIDERESEHPEGKKLSDANEYRRQSNVRQLRNIFQQAIWHYGEDQVNEFLADSDNMYELNTLVDKIAVLYLERDQATADALIVEFASVFNGGPLTESQMQTLEEAGAFDFTEDDLI